MSLAEALAGKEIPNEIRDTLALVNVEYVSFDGEAHEGQLIVHTEVAQEVVGIFSQLLQMEFPIEQVVPIARYGWDDNVSMAANNTSAFNYRCIAGTDRLSNHSFGLAIDINPVLNPYVKDGISTPAGAIYNPSTPGTVTEEIAAVFKQKGWTWGGDWQDRKDWQHFEKKLVL